MYGVYFRVLKRRVEGGDEVCELEQHGQGKVGKGYIDRKGLTRTASANAPGALDTLAFIPCVNERAAYVLEEKLQQSDELRPRHIEQVTTDDGHRSGIEWFDGWTKDRATAVGEFYRLGAALTSRKRLGKEDFRNKARYNQKDASELIAEWFLRGGDMKDFFLLKKPRSGKNATCLLSLAAIAKVYRKVYPDLPTGQPIPVLMTSLWPSAFSGMINDINDYYYDDDVTIEYVNTQEAGWEERYELLCDRGDVDLIVALSSIQSIDKDVAVKCANDIDLREETGLEEIEYDASKPEKLLSLGCRIGIFDESDNGLRTENSTSILNTFNLSHRIWMSGTDLYALRHLAIPGENAYVYDMLREIQDVKAKRIGPRPLIRKAALKPTALPFEEYDPETMDSKGLSRRLAVVFKTDLCVRMEGMSNEEKKRAIRYRLDPQTRVVVDGYGNPVTFLKKSEVYRLMEMIWDWHNTEGWKSPCDHNNIFMTMPMVRAVLALYNMIIQGELDFIDHVPLCANLFRSPSTIEQEVNDAIVRHKKTVFITVGKMLRGAKAPWSAVIRLDDYSDYKVGHQIELRGQNTNDEYFYVYDFNMWRAESMKYDMIRASSNGRNIDSRGKKLHNLIPMMRTGEFESELSTWEDVVESKQHGSVVDGFEPDCLYNFNGVSHNASWLIKLNKSGSGSSTKTTRDRRAGKTASTSKRANKGDAETNELSNLLARAKTIGKHLPELIVLTKGKYRSIDDLMTNVDDETLVSWLSYIGLSACESNVIRTGIVELFEAETINHRIYRVARMVEEKDFDQQDWDAMSRPKDGDVPLSKQLVTAVLDSFPKSFWRKWPSVVDMSCGKGELVEAWCAKLAEYGCPDPENRVYWADAQRVNVEITNSRAGFANGVTCADPTTIITEVRTMSMSKSNLASFDGVIANPPYNGGKIYTRFMDAVPEILSRDGRFALITPMGWQIGSNYESFRRKFLSEVAIEEIISYPTKTFPGVQMPTAVMVGRRSSVGTSHIKITRKERDDTNTINTFSTVIQYDTNVGIIPVPFGDEGRDILFKCMKYPNKLGVKRQSVEGSMDLSFTEAWNSCSTAINFSTIGNSSWIVSMNSSSISPRSETTRNGWGKLYVPVKDEDDAANIRAWMESKLFSLLGYMLQFQKSVSPAVLNILPRLDISGPYTDAKAYKALGLTSHEIEWIEGLS